MITLKYNDYHNEREVVMVFKSGHVEEILTEFRQFLLAIGYADYGQLEFVKDDEE
jgi:hypothetical protein